KSCHSGQGRMWMTQDNQTHVLFRRVIQDLGEVKVRGDQTTFFFLTDFRDNLIFGTPEGFLRYSGHLVACLGERLTPSRVSIFIEFETQHQPDTSTGSTRSRVTSAA